MAQKTPSTDDLALGRAILLVTDSLGMSVEGAFWLYDNDEREWLFFLATSLFGHIDTRAIYLRLTETLKRKLSEHEMDEFMIYLCRPNDRLSKLVREQMTTSANASEAVETTIRLNGRQEKAWVYRMAPTLRTRKLNLARQRFGKRYKELIAA